MRDHRQIALTSARWEELRRRLELKVVRWSVWQVNVGPIVLQLALVVCKLILMIARIAAQGVEVARAVAARKCRVVGMAHDTLQKVDRLV